MANTRIVIFHIKILTNWANNCIKCIAVISGKFTRIETSNYKRRIIMVARKNLRKKQGTEVDFMEDLSTAAREEYFDILDAAVEDAEKTAAENPKILEKYMNV